jgi:Domain of unknown function (DUF4287)/Domain of unknown function (DUF5655)
MSFQAYLDNIKTKTGKTPEDFKKLAEQKGLLKPGMKAGDIISWLKKDFDLGHGHAMAIYAVLSQTGQPRQKKEDVIESHFKGAKAHWKKPFDQLMNQVKEFGDDINIAPANTYLSLVKGNKKFAIVQMTAERMDIGIKLKSAAFTERFKVAGSWNAMVTHRVHISDPKQVDKELLKWLREAYEKA